MEIVHSYAAADEMVGLSMFDGSNDCFFHSGIVHAAETSLFSHTCNFYSLLSFHSRPCDKPFLFLTTCMR